MRRDVQDAEIVSFPGDNGRPVLVSTMRPWPDVLVKTWLVPPSSSPADGSEDDTPNWHLRVHRIETGRDLMSAEGGFAILGTNSWNGRFLTALEEGGQQLGEEKGKEGTIETPSSASVVSRAGVSGVRDLLAGGGGSGRSERKGGICFADANSNLIEARTLLPCLYGDLKAGETVWFVSGVFALPAGSGSGIGAERKWREQWESGVEVPAWVREMIEGEK